MENLYDNNLFINKSDKNSQYLNSENSNQLNYIKTYSSLGEKTINENNYDITNFNYNYDMNNKINYENEDEEKEDDENDLSSEDEYDDRLNNIKYGILKVKLNIFNKIIISKIQKHFFYFISKINLKIKCNEIFLLDDNFLYSKIKLKNSEANKFYALKKLIYVIRKNIYEKLMKQNYFYYWKIMKEDKYLLINKKKKLDSLKAIQFCSILMKIFNKKFESGYYTKYFLSKWKFLMNEKDLYNNKIKKAIIILSSLFNRKIRKIFKKFPRNYLNIKQKSNIFQEINNNKHITDLIENNEKYYQKGLQDFYNYKKKYINLLKQNKLLKIIEKLETKNNVNKSVYKFFQLLKNSSKLNKYKKQIKDLNNSLTDLKFDSMLNAAIIIKIILNEYIHNNLFITKKIFIEELYKHYKFKIIKENYNKNNEDINLNEENSEINNNKIKHQRIFALQKILIINNRHKFFYGDLNLQLKISLLFKYFQIWKKQAFYFAINENIKKLAVQKIFLSLKNIYVNKNKKLIFYTIKKKILQKLFKQKQYYYFSFFLFLLLKQHILIYISKNIFHFIKHIWIKHKNYEYNDQNNYFKCMKLYFIYKKYSKIRTHKYLIRFNFICSFLKRKRETFQEKMKTILINIDKSNNKSILAKLFNNWKEKTKANKKEIQKKQIKINFYLHKIIIMKHLKTLWLYFKKWVSTTNTVDISSNYDDLLNELEKIRKENDNLIAIYYKKRQEYAKTLYDYNFMKKFYCQNCINEKEDEIDYMSLKSIDIKEAGKGNNSLIKSQNKLDISKDTTKFLKKSLEDNPSNQKEGLQITFDENNFVVNEENKFQTEQSKKSLNEENNLSNYVGKKVPQCDGETFNSKNVSDEDNINNVFNNMEFNDIDIKSDNINDYKKEYEEQKKYYENYISILLEKKNELMEMKKMIMSQRLNTSKSE